MTYTEAIQKLRKELQGSLGELARRANCTQPTITSAFNKTNPSDLTKTERRVIEQAFVLLNEQRKQDTEWGQTIVDKVKKNL